MCRAIDAVATGKRLKKLCEARKLSTHDIQDALNLADDRSIYYWFHGRYLPSLENFYLLAQKLECSIDEMIVPLIASAEADTEVHNEESETLAESGLEKDSRSDTFIDDDSLKRGNG